MKTPFAVSALFAALAVLSGCSSSSSGSSSDGSSSDEVQGTPLYCNTPDAHVCIVYGAVDDQERADGTYCSDGDVVTSCATTDLRATCVDTNGLTGTNTTYWYTESTQLTDEDIKFACDQVDGTLTMN